MGELKKRIKAKAEFVDGWNYGIVMIQDEKVLKIVEEARRELDAWKKCHPKFLGESNAPNEYSNLEKFYYARDEWLHKGLAIIEKWFRSEDHE